GRYAVVDFAKNVQEFKAYRGVCDPRADCMLPAAEVRRMDDQTWRVRTNASNNLSISYKVFANDLSGTFSQLNSHHANFNGGSIFMYVVDHKQDPVGLAIMPPAKWRIINAAIDRLNQGQGEGQFPNWDIMIDMPTEIAPDWTED